MVESAKEKDTGRCHAQVSLCCLSPTRGHADLALPLATKTSNTCVRDGSAQRSQLETHRPISLLGLSRQAPSAEYLPKFQIPRRKADVWHKPHCTNSLGIVSHTFQLGNSGNFPEIQVPRLQLRANLVSRSFEGEQSQACDVNPFLGTQALFSLRITRLIPPPLI